MIRKWLFGAFCLGVLLSAGSVCYAGDVPESLLFYDSAQVYFGEIKAVDGDTITVIQRKNVKGEFTQDKEITYDRFTYALAPEIGIQYLCGFLNEDNPLYLWEVTGLNPDTLEIKQSDGMSRTMQEYLNEGKFAEKERERLAAIEEAKPSSVATSQSELPGMTGGESRPPEEDGQSTTSRVVFVGGVLIGVVVWLWWRSRRGA